MRDGGGEPAGSPLTSDSGARPWLLALVFFLAALWLYTRHNDFPFYYHPDEPGKVAQIREGTRNFHHPLLLLATTELSTRVWRVGEDCQAIVERGRWCSAFFAAIAVAGFSWLGFYRFGPPGGLAAGAIMLLQRRPYELAHFMKEDCALLAGIALSFVAMEMFFRRPSASRAFLLGLATALAASSKYVGLIMLAPALLILISRRRMIAWPRALAAFAVGFVLLAAAVNFPALSSWSGLSEGLRYEMAHLHSQSGMEARSSPFGWLRYFLELSPILLIGLAAQFILLARNLRQRPLPQLVLAAFPFCFGLLLCFSSKQAGRHTLPITEIAALLGLYGLLEIRQQARAHHVVWLRRLMIALLLLAALYDLGRTAQFARGFQHDHRGELVDWIRQNLPATAVIAIEERVGISPEASGSSAQRQCEVPPPLPQKLREVRFAADLGSLEQLRAEGIGYVAVAEARFGIFLEEKTARARRGDEIFAARQAFYRRLFGEGQLVWSRETGRVGTLNPGLRLYQIAP